MPSSVQVDRIHAYHNGGNGQTDHGKPAPGVQRTDSTVMLVERQHGGITYPEMHLCTDDSPKKDPTADSRHVLILGAGVSGLLTAWMLLDKGYRVTIIADDWSWTKDFQKSRMTSQIAGALWEYPPGGCGLTEIESPGQGWANIGHYQDWAMQSYEFYTKYDEVSNPFEKDGGSFGLSITKLHQFFYHDVSSLKDGGEEALKLQALKAEDKKKFRYNLDIEERAGEDMHEYFESVVSRGVDRQDLASSYSHRTPIINTDKAMSYLMALVTVKGANFETRKFDKPIRAFGEEFLASYKADAIVNATGLGSKELAEDNDVYPVRGAVRRIENTRQGQFRHLNDAYLMPAQLDLNQHPTKTIFIVPRNDDVLYVGSIIQPHIWEKTLTPDSPEVQVMWNRAGQFMPKLLHAGTVPGFAFAQGLRPFTRRNVKVRADRKATFPLIHNYGHGGSGWTLGVGTARTAVFMVEKIMERKKREKIPVGGKLSVKVYSDMAKEMNDKLYGIEEEAEAWDKRRC